MWYKPSSPNGVQNIRHSCSYADDLKKYGWTKHDGVSYGTQYIIDQGNEVSLTTSWVKPELETDPNYWILRVEGDYVAPPSGTSSEQNDTTIMWYVATPDATRASFDTNHITGDHPSRGTYQVAYNDAPGNKNPSYRDLQNVTETYDADYFFALTIDEYDQYDAKKYYYEEVKDVVSTTPAHLFDPEALYRAETAYSGNLVVM